MNKLFDWKFYLTKSKSSLERNFGFNAAEAVDSTATTDFKPLKIIFKLNGSNC